MIRTLLPKTAAVLLLALPLLAACAPEGPAGSTIGEVRELPSPAGPGSGEPNLFAANGRIYMSWLEPRGERTHALRFARWDGNGWSEPRTIAAGDDFFVNWADFPSIIALPDGTLAAHWLVRSGPATYAYDVHIARSRDDGATWSESVVPHRDGTQTEHGFVSLFPWNDGGLAAVWLDGRNYAEAEGHGHGNGNGGPEMTLRKAVLDADGAIRDEALLDERVCDCCQTAAALTSQGPVVVYRDRSPEEIRDISLIRFRDGGWTAPQPVHHDGWQIPGCPVNGPAIAADGDRVAVAWFTAADEAPRVNVAFSTNAGSSFHTPIRIDDGDPLGRVGVVLLPDGTALVSWLERTEEDAEVRVRVVAEERPQGAGLTVARTSAARASGFPRMVRTDDGVFFAWTDTAEPGGIRFATARLD